MELINDAQQSRRAFFSRTERERIELNSRIEGFVSGKRGLSVSKILLNNPESYVSAVRTLTPVSSCLLCGSDINLRGEDSEKGRAIYKCINEFCGVFYDSPLK